MTVDADAGTVRVDALVGELFQPDSPSRTDPYPVFAALRELGPVHRSDIAEGWIVTTAAGARAVLASPDTTVRPNRSGGWAQAAGDGAEAVLEVLGKVLLFTDDPEHARLRGLVAKAFTPRAVEALRARVSTLVDELLDDIEQRGSTELMADFAFPLPVTVIAELLGVPPADRGLFREHIPKLTPLLEFDLDASAMEGALGALGVFAGYFGPLFEERRQRPGDDLLSALVAAEVAGDRLDPVELLVTAVLLLGAGHETTMNLIGNGTLALLAHPDELARLRDDPSLDRGAVEELLRFDSPVQFTARRTTAPLDVEGTVIPSGDEVVVLLGAANRDPARFPAPDRVDLTRSAGQHLAFGHGAHFCLGVALARLEGEIAIGALVRRFPELRLTATPEWRPTRTLRGLDSLQLTW